MLEKDKSPAKKSPARKKSSATKKTTTRKATPRKTKKPKVVLAKKKVILFCSAVSGICILSLVLTILLNQMEESKSSHQEPQKTEIIAKSDPEPRKEAIKETKKELPVEKKRAAPQKKSVVEKENPVLQKKSEPAVKKTEPSLPKNSSVAKNTPTVQTESISKKSVQSPQKNYSVEKEHPTLQKKSSPEKTASTKRIEPAKKVTPSPEPFSATMTQNQPSRASNPQNQLASNKTPYQEETIQQNIPKNRFDLPPASNGATIVIIIDDAGRSVENTKRYASLPFPITIAVLPRLANSRACADAIRAAGKEVILHQPMQSFNHNLDPGPGKITADMSTYEIASIVKENLLSLGPGVKGMNNHEGSEITANIIKIGAVLEVCNEMGVYFLDSRTTAQTQAPQAALERDMHIFEKAGPYLDNEIDRAKMIERMRETLMYANRHGKAVVIGHVDKSVKILPDLLNEMYPEMKYKGYRFATPSTLRY